MKDYLSLLQIYQSALAAVDPERVVEEALRELEVPQENVWVVGAGKAVPAMARAVEHRLGAGLAGGLLITREGHVDPHHHSRLEFREASHPILDQRGLDATRELLSLVDARGPDDFVLVLLSGGASALLELPVEGLTLADLQATNRLLLLCGASIQEINCVRQHLSQVKGGRLGQRLRGPALTLVLSDVVGGDVSMIGSGPSVSCQSTPAQARAVLARYGLTDRVPGAVAAWLERAPSEPVVVEHPWCLVADNRRMAHAAVDRARHLGLDARLLTAFLEGESSQVGLFLASLARELRSQHKSGCLVLSGETTVTVRGSGSGGRCQELALAFAIACQLPGVQLLAGSSDGHDGPTEAAGALVDGETCRRARERGLDPGLYLAENDSFGFFRALDEVWTTGPTGTNTNDLIVLKVD